MERAANPGARVSSLAVVGAGWAGLAAAVRACERGFAVTLYEMAPHAGGRARRIDVAHDNGQHILIGAYRHTLALMRAVGADPERLLLRLPLELRFPDGRGLRLPPGRPLPAFARAVLGATGWTWPERLALLATASRWAARGFRCDAALSVDTLCAALPRAVRELLIDPLCVAALNTPAREASAAVWLRVLRDALFGGPGSADLLLPTAPLSALLPEPALVWLERHGVALRLAHRVRLLAPDAGSWCVDGERHDLVVLACSAVEAARLARPHAADWADAAARLRHEPIASIVLGGAPCRLPAPMMALREGPEAPAQYVFDHALLTGQHGRLVAVVSGARAAVERGLAPTGVAVARQVALAFGWNCELAVERVVCEKRATFACTPRLARPAVAVAPGLAAAGDHVDGPYPATLEGAVRSGEAAVDLLAAGSAPDLRRGRPAQRAGAGANGAASGSPTKSPCCGHATLRQ